MYGIGTICKHLSLLTPSKILLASVPSEQPRYSALGGKNVPPARKKCKN